MSPTKAVALLDEIFVMMDEASLEFGIEKIKTIADCFMAVAGLAHEETRFANHAEACVEFALHVRSGVQAICREKGIHLSTRAGINTGPLVAGVIGLNRFAFDVWGDTVNVASRMESQCPLDGIQVSEATFHEVANLYEVEERPGLEIKGKGTMNAYVIAGRKRTGAMHHPNALHSRENSMARRPVGVAAIRGSSMGSERFLKALASAQGTWRLERGGEPSGHAQGSADALPPPPPPASSAVPAAEKQQEAQVAVVEEEEEEEVEEKQEKVARDH